MKGAEEKGSKRARISLRRSFPDAPVSEPVVVTSVVLFTVRRMPVSEAEGKGVTIAQSLKA